MEKYSRYRDEGTGIAPFQSARRNSQQYNVAQLIFLFLLSMGSTVVAWIGLLLYTVLIRFILPKFLSRWFIKGWILAALRVFYTSFYYEGERRASVRKTSIRKAKAGDVILTNFLSPLDPLVYEFYLPGASFVFPTADGLYESVSLPQVMWRALSANASSTKGRSLENIASEAKRANSIVVLFVEGTTTNGRGLLTLKNLNVHDIAKVGEHVYVAALKYTPGAATAPVPQSLLGYLWSTSYSTWWYIASVKVSSEPLTKSTLNRDQISKGIAGLGRLRILGDKLDVGSKQQYVEQRRKGA